MDSNETLNKIRRLIKAMEEGGPEAMLDYAAGLCEAFSDLDGWLSKGGFLPADWDRRKL